MEVKANPEMTESQMKEADNKELQKITREMKLQQMNYKKRLKEDLELMRLEHEFLKIQVETYQYSQMLEQIRMKEAEKAEMMKEAEEKQKAAASAKKTSSKKIIVPDKTLVDMQGRPIEEKSE